MDQRRGLARLVIEEGVSLSEAARRFGVSRVTAGLWVSRAKEVGLAELHEKSRRPHTSPGATSQEHVARLLAAKQKRPYWGAKKLLVWLWGDSPPISLSTANRILMRNHLSCRSPGSTEAVNSFEHPFSNDLWQADFKGLKGPRRDYEVLSLVDDSTRFCLGFLPIANQSVEVLWEALWSVFGEYGLPARILSDNGTAFRAGATRLPSTLQVRLWRLGVSTSYCRVGHPQTQGKVERFHRAAQLELGAELRQQSAELASKVYEEFRVRYNWERPHEALGMRTPGTLYKLSERRRPDKLPEHEIPEGVLTRKVDNWGNISHKGNRYKLGKGLRGERVILAEGDHDLKVVYMERTVGYLEDFKV
ncbi:MAG: integrase core domain-containing protein [Fimbriimonadaceae bacterium]